jgi:hypothetical protein
VNCDLIIRELRFANCDFAGLDLCSSVQSAFISGKLLNICES